MEEFDPSTVRRIIQVLYSGTFAFKSQGEMAAGDRIDQCPDALEMGRVIRLENIVT
jgi:hypothetical protein